MKVCSVLSPFGQYVTNQIRHEIDKQYILSNDNRQKQFYHLTETLAILLVAALLALLALLVALLLGVALLALLLGVDGRKLVVVLVVHGTKLFVVLILDGGELLLGHDVEELAVLWDVNLNIGR